MDTTALQTLQIYIPCILESHAGNAQVVTLGAFQKVI